MTTESLDRIISRLIESAPQHRGPIPDEELDALTVTLPPELRQLFRRTQALDLPGGAAIFDLDDLEHVNRLDHLKDELPGVVFFGSDGSDGFFFIDVVGGLGRSPGAVFCVDRGALDPGSSVPCGWSLTDFLGRVAQGEQPWKGPTLGELELQEMIASLDDHPDRWDGFPGMEPGAIHAMSRAKGIGLPRVAWRLLERAERLRFVDSAIELGGPDRIDAVEGAINEFGQPSAAWFGAGPDGESYLITLGGHRGLPPGELMVVESGASPREARRLGPLARVVARWARGGSPS